VVLWCCGVVVLWWCDGVAAQDRPNMAGWCRALAEAKALLGTSEGSGAVEGGEASFAPDGEDSLECSLDLTPVPGHSLVSGDGSVDRMEASPSVWCLLKTPSDSCNEAGAGVQYSTVQ